MNQHQFVPKGTGKGYDYSQDHCVVKLASNQTSGELSIVEDRLKPKFRLPRHHHKIMTEVFYMLEGELDIILDEETVVLRSGDTLTVPPNVWHAAYSKNGGRMLTIFKDGQFDEYLERLSTMTESQFTNVDLMKSTAEKYDIYE